MEIVTSDGIRPSFIVLIDVATGAVRTVVDGRAAIWVDDHTLFVEVEG